jgi:hypothetical protein
LGIEFFTFLKEYNTVNMIDPQQAIDAFKYKTSSLLVPTHSAHPSVSPIPTVIPNIPQYERIGETGAKTLWVSFAFCLGCFNWSPTLTTTT